MLFAKYIQLIHYYLEPGINRGKFTEEILNRIVKDNKPLNYSDSSYNGFYDGKTEGTGTDKKVVGDKINQCAYKIKNYLDEQKYSEYLKSFSFNTDVKKELCKSFKCEIPDINIDNYADKLAKLLIQIIKNAANEKNAKTPYNTISDKMDNHVDTKTESDSITTTKHYDNNVEGNCIDVVHTPSKSNLDGIKDVIIALNDLVDDLDMISFKICICSSIETAEQKAEEQQELDNRRKEFERKNRELRLYKVIFPTLKEIIDEMLSMYYSMTFYYYYIRDENNQLIIKGNEQVDNYKKCIDKLMIELNNF